MDPDKEARATPAVTSPFVMAPLYSRINRTSHHIAIASSNCADVGGIMNNKPIGCTPATVKLPSCLNLLRFTLLNYREDLLYH